jgi:outer membrane protein
MKVATAALLLTSLGSPAWAQATLPDIDASKRMILAGRPQDAKVILDNLASLHPDSPDVLFLLADIAVSEQDYDRAIELYRRILVREPNLTRVRLELARTFFLVRDDETAEYHFRLAQGASDLPPEVAANIEKFLDAIRARKDWRIDLTVAAAPDTNINTGPDAEIVVIGGLPYRLSGTARRTSGLGLSSSLGGEYVAGLSDTIQMRAGGQIWRAEYSGDDFDDTIANGFAGPHFLFDQGEVSVLASGWRRWYAGEPYAGMRANPMLMHSAPGSKRAGSRYRACICRRIWNGWRCAMTTSPSATGR